MKVFNVIEKEIAISQVLMLTETVMPHLQQGSSAKDVLLIKALANYIERTSPRNPEDLLQSVDRLLHTGNTPQALQRLLIYMVTLGVDSEPVSARIYTTGDVARFFGVSVATINNWINQGRFQGIEKGERFKQARIPENAIYTASTGVTSTVAEVSERYEYGQSHMGRTKPMTEMEEQADLLNTIVHFEKKYGGSLEETLAKRKDLTPAETRDEEQWIGLLQSLERRQN